MYDWASMWSHPVWRDNGHIVIVIRISLLSRKDRYFKWRANKINHYYGMCGAIMFLIMPFIHPYTNEKSRLTEWVLGLSLISANCILRELQGNVRIPIIEISLGIWLKLDLLQLQELIPDKSSVDSLRQIIIFFLYIKCEYRWDENSRKHVAMRDEHETSIFDEGWLEAIYLSNCEWVMIGPSDRTEYSTGSIEFIWVRASAWCQIKFAEHLISRKNKMRWIFL